MVRQGSDTNACGDRVVDRRDAYRGDGCAEGRVDALGPVKARVGEQDQELLAPNASDKVAVAAVRFQDGAKGSQYVIAGAVPVRVVDRLEVIEIQRERR